MGARYLDGRGTGRGPIEPTFSRLFSPPTPIFSARWCLTLLEPLQGYRASPARFAWWPVGWGVRMAGFTIWHRGSLTTEGKQQGGATTPAPKSCAALRGIETRTACSPHPGNWKPAIVRRPFGGLRHLWRTIGVASRDEQSRPEIVRRPFGGIVRSIADRCRTPSGSWDLTGAYPGRPRLPWAMGYNPFGVKNLGLCRGLGKEAHRTLRTLAPGDASPMLTPPALPFFVGNLEWLHAREGHRGRPYWPGGKSGVTLDPGVDLGHASRELVGQCYRAHLSNEQWRAVLAVLGLRGAAASSGFDGYPELAGIRISRQLARYAESFRRSSRAKLDRSAVAWEGLKASGGLVWPGEALVSSPVLAEGSPALSLVFPSLAERRRRRQNRS